MSELTLEQKIVLHLAKKGYLTHAGDVTTALKDNEYAKKLITGNAIPGIDDEIDGSGESDCDHEALTNEEIQEVFDNDNDKNNETV